MLAASLGVLILPTWAIVQLHVGGIHGPWLCLSAYIVFLATAFGLRFRSGKWQDRQVIETAPLDGCP